MVKWSVQAYTLTSRWSQTSVGLTQARSNNLSTIFWNVLTATFQYIHLHKASFVRQKYRNAKGGKQRAHFLGSLWAFKVLFEELRAQTLEQKKLSLEREVERLTEENKVLQEKVQNFAKRQSEKKRKSLDACSESHKRLLKRKRTISC